jgi:cysteinyl-tRNA synthetase
MKVFNTLSRTKEEFIPLGDDVKMYVCGVTPYAEAHIGHAMSYVDFDVIRRYLKFKGYKVKYIQNITDIDDKIIERANRLGVPPTELAEGFAQSFAEDMAALNVTPADDYPRATGEIDKIIEVIQGLMDKGYAYAIAGSVYFRVRKDTDYGKLAHRSLEQMMAGARVEVDQEKEYPMDFVLWKASKEGEPAWNSPWGPGRPGWHIECSVMSIKYLGETIDIHGGGQDLIFPHHENEIAQSEGFTGKKPFVRYWLHNGLLRLGEEKMSKSLGNLITIKEALVKYSADAVRIFVLSSHYRSPLTYSEEALEAVESGLKRLRQAAGVGREDVPDELSGAAGVDTKVTSLASEYRHRFVEAMDDDFNTAQAIAVLFDLASEINQAANQNDLARVTEHLAVFREIAGVLGLKLESLVEIGGFFEPDKIGKSEIVRMRGEKLYQLLETIKTLITDPAKDIEKARGNINLALAVRASLRQDKQFESADEIRAKLGEAGIIIEDKPQGIVQWRRRRQL